MAWDRTVCSMTTSSTLTQPALPWLLFSVALGALAASGCSARIDGFVSLGSDSRSTETGGASTARDFLPSAGMGAIGTQAQGAQGGGGLGPGDGLPSTGGTQSARNISNTKLEAPSLAMGQGQSCLAQSDGTVKCWGVRELYASSKAINATPVLVPGLAGVASLSSNPYRFYAVLQDGTVLGPWTPGGNLPPQPSGITNASAISAGETDPCALLRDGTVECWQEYNAATLLTDFQVVENITNATAISSEGCTFHACAALATGEVRCWGGNSGGQLGDGTTVTRSGSVAVIGLTNAVQVGVGCSISCAVLQTGQVACWGGMDPGRSGYLITPSPTPVTVSGISTATAVSVASITSAVSYGQHACVLLADGRISCWGGNSHGQLGNSTTTDSKAPVMVSNITDATAVAAGTAYSCAAFDNGSVRCWGLNDQGQLGNGTTIDSATPVDVVGL
jgi:alpha-tubulin suppressor-like RCC1 family protein